jgi:phosphoribosylformylglycinamidine (FGAM) synthase-like amidotransferase family enzyme
VNGLYCFGVSAGDDMIDTGWINEYLISQKVRDAMMKRARHWNTGIMTAIVAV